MLRLKFDKIINIITVDKQIKKTKINFKIKKIENLERITQIFFANRRKMINKPFSKIYNKNKKVLLLSDYNSL